MNNLLKKIFTICVVALIIAAFLFTFVGLILINAVFDFNNKDKISVAFFFTMALLVLPPLCFLLDRLYTSGLKTGAFKERVPETKPPVKYKSTFRNFNELSGFLIRELCIQREYEKIDTINIFENGFITFYYKSYFFKKNVFAIANIDLLTEQIDCQINDLVQETLKNITSHPFLNLYLIICVENPTEYFQNRFNCNVTFGYKEAYIPVGYSFKEMEMIIIDHAIDYGKGTYKEMKKELFEIFNLCDNDM